MKLLRKRYWFGYYLIVDARNDIVGRGNTIFEQREVNSIFEIKEKLENAIKEAHALAENRTVILRSFYRI